MKISDRVKVWYEGETVHLLGPNVRATMRITADQLWHIYKKFSETAELNLEIKELKGEEDGRT
jgi:hypothetical protein